MTIGVLDYAKGRHALSVKLDKQSTRRIWLMVGTATAASAAASYIASQVDVPTEIPLMNFSFTVTAVLWFGTIIYAAVCWIRRYIKTAAKSVREQVVADVVAASQTIEVGRWRRIADEAEPHLRSVGRGGSRN